VKFSEIEEHIRKLE